MTERIQLHVPAEKLFQYAGNKGYGDIVRLRATSRKELLQRSDVEIMQVINAEIRGLVSYYSLATGYKSALAKLVGLAQLCYFATLAHKHKTSSGRIASRMRLPHGKGYGFWIERNGRPKLYKLFRLPEHVKPKISVRIDEPWSTAAYSLGRNELIRRLNANRCEYCGKDGGYIDVHHVRALKDVKGKKHQWQLEMSAMNRKTMVLCKDCHTELHGRGLPYWRHKAKLHP